MSDHDPREAERTVRALYQRRDEEGRRRLADPDRPENVAWSLTRSEAAREALRLAGRLSALESAYVLDIGCGTGHWLGQMEAWGANPRRLVGVDLLRDRVREAKNAHPEIGLVVGSGWRLPFATDTFDLVSMFTVLSSLPDPAGRRSLGAEVLRVLRRGGQVLVYDFCVRRPGSRDLVAINRRDVEEALGGAVVWSHSLTLAPPLARPLGRLGARAVVVAERLCAIFRTHRMYLLQFS